LLIVHGWAHGAAGTTDVIQWGLSQRHPERFIYEEFSIPPPDRSIPALGRTLRQGMGPGQRRRTARTTSPSATCKKVLNPLNLSARHRDYPFMRPTNPMAS